MTMRHLVLGTVALAALAGCATVPTAPAVTVLPGSRKTLDQFNADDVTCRQYAYAALGPDAGYAANNAAAGSALGGAALGAAAGAIIGSATGHAGEGAAIGAGTGLLFGSAYGSQYGYDASWAMQATYDRAYVQCMYARGHQVPGGTAYRALPSYPGYAPPANAVPYPSSPGYRPPPPAGSRPPPSSVPPAGGYPPPGTRPPAS